MPPKAKQSLEELQAQARRNFRYWPIYLMLRLREVEQHLSATERDQLGKLGSTEADLEHKASHDLDIAILLEYGLLAGDEALAKIASPKPIPIPEAQIYSFRTGMSLIAGQLKAAFQSLDFVAVLPQASQRLEILRVPAHETDVLHTATRIFTAMQEELSLEVALEAARLWAALHGARLLAWETLPNHLLDEFLPPELSQLVTTDGSKFASLAKVLPPRRKRGKGLFRDAN
jgi:hypothetical protein